MLAFVSPRLRDDDRIVLIAVQQNGLSLRHASDRLRGDWGIVLTAVRKMVWLSSSPAKK